MKTFSTALSHSAVPLDRSIADDPNRTLRVRNGAQAAMLTALGTLSSSLTLVYLMAKHPPLVLLVAAPLWSLWLLSLVDWLRGDELTGIPVTTRVSTLLTTHLSTPTLDSVRSDDGATLSQCWQRVAQTRAALARDSGRPEETSGSG